LDQQVAEGTAELASYQSLVDNAQQVVLAEQTKLKQQDEQVAVVAIEIAALESQLTQLQAAKKALTDSASLVTDASAFAAATAELDRANEARTAQLTEVKTKMNSMAEQRATMLAAADAATMNRDQAMVKRNEFDAKLKTMVAQRDQFVIELNGRIKQCAELRTAVSSDRQNQHAVAAERPLSPEQLGMSILRSTHVLGNYIANEHTELNKQGELPADANEAQKMEREKRAVRGAIDKLRGNIDVFSNLYSSGVGQTNDEFFASPDQALYFANGGSIHAWAGPSGSNISSRVFQATDPHLGAKQLYTALLSREPTAIEQQFIVEQLNSAGDSRPAVIQELVWSILAGAEYRLYP
jgi:multidrug efflux pump subunit AcrA (membrane-fusion protein)